MLRERNKRKKKSEASKPSKCLVIAKIRKLLTLRVVRAQPLEKNAENPKKALQANRNRSDRKNVGKVRRDFDGSHLSARC